MGLLAPSIFPLQVMLLTSAEVQSTFPHPPFCPFSFL